MKKTSNQEFQLKRKKREREREKANKKE